MSILYTWKGAEWFPTSWIHSISISDDNWMINFHAWYLSGNTIWWMVFPVNSNITSTINENDIAAEFINMILTYIVRDVSDMNFKTSEELKRAINMQMLEKLNKHLKLKK